MPIETKMKKRRRTRSKGYEEGKGILQNSIWKHKVK
jgi:hypothetical protein